MNTINLGQADLKRHIQSQFDSFIHYTDYEVAYSYYEQAVRPMIDCVLSAEERSDLRFDFMEHLHDLSVLHNAGYA